MTANELRVFLDVLGENVTKEEVDEMIAICDINGLKYIYNFHTNKFSHKNQIFKSYFL